MHSLLHHPIKAHIAQKISEIFKQLGTEHAQEKCYELIGTAPKLEMGDFAFPCFPFAKTLKISPAQIAQKVEDLFPKDQYVSEAKSFGPYINFFLWPKAMAESFVNPILSGEFFDLTLIADPPKTMIEYSQPNTHKELHVGHMRNLSLGDALIRLHRYAGFEIIASTFPGDVGTHVAKCLWYMQNINQDPIPERRKGEWLGKQYVAATQRLEEIAGTKEETEVKVTLGNILKELEKGAGSYFDLWKETREWSIHQMKEVYDWAEADFDIWYWESDVDADSVVYAQDLAKEGKLVESRGAVGMNLEDVDLGFCLLLKSDGTGLYATKDVELARRKFQDHGVEKSVYVVDQSQSHHFKQVFEVLKRLGFEHADKCFHLAYEVVELPDGKMSSRKGNVVPILELIHQMEERIKKGHLARYVDDWPDDEIASTARCIARAAIKYGMIRVDNNRKIVFKMEDWLKVDGESGPYVQYACVRVKSMVKKFPSNLGDADFAKLTQPSERQVLLHLSAFNEKVLEATLQYRTATMCSYLFDLAKAFNAFYNQVDIGRERDISTQAARLALAQAVAISLEKGLNLLGIQVPDRM